MLEIFDSKVNIYYACYVFTVVKKKKVNVIHKLQKLNINKKFL